MSITVACDCGRSLRVKDELAGRKIRCPECGEVLAVAAGGAAQVRTAVVAQGRPKPPPLRMPPEDEEEETRVRRGAGSRGRPAWREEEEERGGRRGLESRRRPTPRDEEDEDEERLPRKRKKKKRSRTGSGEGLGLFAISIDPQIITGLLMMVGAAVWFIVAMSNGVIFFYPPVLFVLGAATVVRGFMGGD